MRIHCFGALLLVVATPFSSGSAFAQQGTSATQPPAAEATSADHALVFIYRYKTDYGSDEPVFCDEKNIAKLDNGRYLVAKLPPGRHTFRSGDKQSGIELNLKAGQKYYIRVELPAVGLNPHGRVSLIPQEQGAYEVKNLRPIDSRKVKDRQIVISPEPGKR